ncbi:phosphoenolpyruvate--protein phosphotransferase [Catenovulum sp. SM1970]|uniref:phosphoenolpyruvate--protein phosphotransferase n=1 Tax=Marinifaba aquimaris TaxID=2741323 RepID=UPI0015720995|nr:phosphoenolpyruvate--protein phosphotransferase [Marinifaba aquimaris]NTS76443.1 phosphoenolpyruvate--protein phosphotransferase [Marinifaba aquimaris]
MITTLKHIVESFIQQPVLERALEQVVTDVKVAMKTQCCSIYFADHEQQDYQLMATDGLAREAVGHIRVGFSQGLVSLVGQREEPVNIANAPSHPRFLVAPEAKEDAYNAFLGAPIIHQRKVLGVISVQQSESRHFDEDEVAFLVTLAAQLASVIAHAKIRDLLEKPTVTQQHNHKYLRGVPGSSGIAIGQAYVHKPVINFESVLQKKHHNLDKELTKLDLALAHTQEQLSKLSDKVGMLLPSDASAIFDVYKHLLNDPVFIERIQSEIKSGWSVATALKTVVEETVEEFEQIDDEYIKERITDVKDVCQRLLVNLLAKDIARRKPPREMILVAEEVTASLLVELSGQKIKGICSRLGSSNSHATILARAFGIPAVMGLVNLPVNTLDGHELVLDGYSGQIHITPDESVVKEYQRLANEEEELAATVQQTAELEAETIDGTQIDLFINTGLSADLDCAKDILTSGIGLYRTEIPFMVRDRFPTENEQVALYQSVLNAYPHQSVTMRTLDVGGDKPLPYFPIEEDNPFLGWRGIRLTLDHPEIQLVQIRAMLRANMATQNLSILLPMVTSVAEVQEAKRLIHQAHSELSEELGTKVPWPKIGVMIEVPATIYQIEQLSKLVDYFSIGTNDLTQYLLAVDRNNARVAGLYDYYHPGVIQALLAIVRQCQQAKKPVTVCGEMAGEPIGLILLLAMGYRQFSMSAHNLLKAKWILRNISIQDTLDMLEDIEALSCPKQIKDFMFIRLEKVGLGGFVRAGK